MNLARALGAALALVGLLAGCDATLPFLATPEPTPEQPRLVVVEVVSGADETPVAGATVTLGAQAVVTDADGRAPVSAVSGETVTVVAAEHDSATSIVPREGELRVSMRPNVMRGTVRGVDGTALAGVRLFVDGGDHLAVSDDGGRYELPGLPAAGVVVAKRAGYRLVEIPIDDQMAKDVAMEPFEARALYAPAGVFEAPGRLEAMLELIERTEVNALVIDVKETDGRLFYDTDLAAAREIGAVRDTPVFDPDELLPMLRERGIYTIARMVVMKDNTMAAARPELAVHNTATGGPWTDNIGGAWLDPSAPGVAEYVAAVAADVADVGFDEVQLDYIRWYSDGPSALADTNVPNTQSYRLPAIRRVLRVVSDEFATRRAFLGADVFPISFIVPDDQGIGQRPEVILPYVDYACPMVYPSHYGPGVFGFAVPNEHPYEVVAETLQVMSAQADGMPLVLRPWIQDFGYGTFAPYSAAQVQAEMQAAAEHGAGGWMIWNPRASFTEQALAPARDGEEAGPLAWTDPGGAAASPSPGGGTSPPSSP